MSAEREAECGNIERAVYEYLGLQGALCRGGAGRRPVFVGRLRLAEGGDYRLEELDPADEDPEVRALFGAAADGDCVVQATNGRVYTVSDVVTTPLPSFRFVANLFADKHRCVAPNDSFENGSIVDAYLLHYYGGMLMRRPHRPDCMYLGDRSPKTCIQLFLMGGARYFSGSEMPVAITPVYLPDESEYLRYYGRLFESKGSGRATSGYVLNIIESGAADLLTALRNGADASWGARCPGCEDIVAGMGIDSDPHI